MKIAHLILAHKSPEQLERLLTSCFHKDDDYYLHIDGKTDITSFLRLGELRNVFFVKKRVKVYWGSYSMIEATVQSFKEIILTGKYYDFINLLSGDDYPLSAPQNVHQFLQANSGKAFIEVKNIEELWEDDSLRIRRYYFDDYFKVNSNRFARIINVLLPLRKTPSNLRYLVGGSQWFTIPPSHAVYIMNFLAQNPKIKKYFRLTFGADECLFHSILYNSPLSGTIVNDNLRYIDWSEKKMHPKVLRIEDKDKILSSGKLWARKFSISADSEILECLDNNRIETKSLS